MRISKINIETQKISRPPVAFTESINPCAARNGASHRALASVIVPWNTSTGTTENITPQPNNVQGVVTYSAPAPIFVGEPRTYGPVPAIDEHTAMEAPRVRISS